MAGGLFSRLKSWRPWETILNSDLNAEINNVINNLKASLLTGHSATVSEMQETESPGDVGSESLAASVADEVKRLRYQMDLIIGATQWYEPPPASLTDLNTTIAGLQTIPSSRIVSGKKDANNQPMFLVPHGTNPAVTLDCTPTALQLYINGVQRTFSADLQITTLQTAPSANNTCVVSDPTLSGAQVTRTLGERGTQIPINTIGTEISSLNGKYAAFKKGTEYFLAEIDTGNNYLKNCFRGVGFDSSESWLPRATLSNSDTITLMKLAWIFATYNSSTAALALVYNTPTMAAAEPSGPAIGDYWYDLVNSTWKNYDGAAWNDTEAVLIGIAICDSSGCKAARSFDFYRSFNALNTVDIDFAGSATVRSTHDDQRISVYGTTFPFDKTRNIWSTSTSLDSGVSLGASTTYYAYVTDTGALKVSDVRPSERKFDLRGGYHPAKPWRCVGEFRTDGSSNIVSSSISISDHRELGPVTRRDIDRRALMNPGECTNMYLVASVSASALTIELRNVDGFPPSITDPVLCSFRSSTLTSGQFNLRKILGAISATISSGSKLGHTDAAEWPIYVYLIDVSETVQEIAYSTSPVDERLLQTTIAEGGAGAADSAATLYSTTARSNVPVRLVGVLLSTQTTAGTWAAVPTSISAPTQPHPLAYLAKRKIHTVVGIGGVGISASSGAFTLTSAAFTDVTNMAVTISTSGRPVQVICVPDGSANPGGWNPQPTGGAIVTCFIQLLRDGVAVAATNYMPLNVAGANAGVLCPPGAFQFIDDAPAGTYEYKIQIKSDGTRTVGAIYMKLVALEL